MQESVAHPRLSEVLKKSCSSSSRIDPGQPRSLDRGRSLTASDPPDAKRQQQRSSLPAAAAGAYSKAAAGSSSMVAAVLAANTKSGGVGCHAAASGSF